MLYYNLFCSALIGFSVGAVSTGIYLDIRNKSNNHPDYYRRSRFGGSKK